MPRARAVILTLSVVVLMALGAAELGRFGPHDLSRFEHDSGVDLPDWYGDHPALLLWTRGDGTAFVLLGIDPTFDGPANRLLSGSYRFQRVGYSLAGRIAALGQADLVPIGLMAVNLIAVGVYAARVADLASADRRVLWLLANPAIYLGATGNMAEPLGLALLLSAVTARRRLGMLSAFVLGTVRPSYATPLPAGNRPRATTAAAAGAFLLVAVLGSIVGPGGLGLANFTWPGFGYWDAFTRGRIDTGIIAATVLVGILATLVYGVTRVPGALARVAWISTAGLGLCLSILVTDNPINLLRAVGAVPVLWGVEIHRVAQSRLAASLPSNHG